MYLKKVTLKNVRSFHGKRRVDLDLTRPDGTYAGWTVLAGRNGSGKTTLLRAMAMAVSGPDVARSLVPGFDTWVSSGANGATVNVTLDFDRALDTFIADDAEIPRAPFDAGLSWMFPAGRHEGSPPRMGELHTDFALEDVHRNRGPWSYGMPGWFCAGYGPFRRLVGGSSDVQRLMGVE
ncbi:MAG: AAA family ATPase, partial [Sciscionella sp.]